MLLACAGVILVADAAGAQPAPTPSKQAVTPRESRLRGRFELTVGAGWWGDSRLGRTTASIPGNGAPRGDDFILFTTDARIASAAAFEATLGYRLTPLISAEAGVGLGQPEVRTTVIGDVEVPETVTATDRLIQLSVEGALVVRLPRLTIARVTPFVRGGAGYVRQLHEGRRVVDTGQVFFVGAGMMYPLLARSRGAIRGVALRGDVRAVWYREAFELDDRRPMSLNAGLGLTVRF